MPFLNAHSCKINVLQTVCVALLIGLFFSSCSDKQQSGKKVFYLNLSSGNLESMDPVFSNVLYTMWVDHMVYNTLVETDEQLHLQPCLAKSWDISEDGLSYTFHLRGDVFFHDAPEFANGKGRKMTASDVVYSFNRIVDAQIASPGSWIFNGRVAEENAFTATDDRTFRLKLNAPFRPMLAILSMMYCSIVPHEVVDHWGKDFRSHPCGTGPFQYKYWDEGNVLVLHKNERYWETDSATGKRLPYVDAVQIGFVDSKATEFLLFLQGKLDFVNGLDGSFKDLILTKEGKLKKEFERTFKLKQNTYLDTEYLGFLTDSTSPVMHDMPTRNVLVRQAINYAIDRQKIVTYFRNGVSYPATSGFIPAGMPGFDSSAGYGYHYNPQKAAQLLVKAGYPNGKGMKPITLYTRDNWADIVNFIATELQEVGIPVKVEIMQPNVLIQQMSRSQSVFFRATWLADYPDAETYLVVFNSKQPAPPNYTRLNNKAFDDLYDKSMNAPDSLRYIYYRQLDSIAMSQAPVVPLYYDRLLHFTQNNIMGLTSNPMNVIDLKRVTKD
ncbi:MAG: ABC transporter substrate-binding protein [Sphingobacteriales bacterium]|nr:MAG: ABC transporter substrate-binding protein [Sphingobacteriales bacterium]